MPRAEDAPGAHGPHDQKSELGRNQRVLTECASMAEVEQVLEQGSIAVVRFGSYQLELVTGHVIARDRAWVAAGKDDHVEAFDDAVVKGWYNCDISVGDRARAIAYDQVTVHAVDSGTVDARGEAVVEALGHASVRVSGHTRVQGQDQVRIVATGYA